tara:strand:- start:536 stop:742 length:207 start_codon:yes stop_codon:yes gene_type:complete
MRFISDVDGDGFITNSIATLPTSLPVVEFAAPILVLTEFVAGLNPAAGDGETVVAVAPFTPDEKTFPE